MNWKDKSKGEYISEKDWAIVEERLKTMPGRMQLGLLSSSYTKDQLIVEVQNKTEVGTAYAEMQLEFLKWLLKQSKILQ
ncbi:hypothetical protein HZA98_01160 [Candidatus Woesearchaeota archaeon]|nr:hypothetical protein [Candidatus Woesearchaeota archaeon]